jgi:hypothetical protein
MVGQGSALDAEGNTMGVRQLSYEPQRLVLIAGCVAAAAAADLGGGALPQPKVVAVGAALMGGLLVLRRRPLPGLQEPEETIAAEEEPQATPARRHRFRRYAEAPAVNAWIESLTAKVEEHEQRLTSLSGRQSVLQVSLRDQLAELQERMAAFELALEGADAQTRKLRDQVTQHFQGIVAQLADQTAELTTLARKRAPDAERASSVHRVDLRH